MEGKKWGRPGNEADDGNQASIKIHVLNLSVVTTSSVTYPVHKTHTKKAWVRDYSIAFLMTTQKCKGTLTVSGGLLQLDKSSGIMEKLGDKSSL